MFYNLYYYRIYMKLVYLSTGIDLYAMARLYVSKCSSIFAHSSSVIDPFDTFEYTA